MTTQETLVTAKQNQIELEGKRTAIILRLQLLQIEIDAVCAISEYARESVCEKGDASFNLADESMNPKEVIPLVEKSSFAQLLEWEDRAQKADIENTFRNVMVRKNQSPVAE